MPSINENFLQMKLRFQFKVFMNNNGDILIRKNKIPYFYGSLTTIFYLDCNIIPESSRYFVQN